MVSWGDRIYCNKNIVMLSFSNDMSIISHWYASGFSFNLMFKLHQASGVNNFCTTFQIFFSFSAGLMALTYRYLIRFQLLFIMTLTFDFESQKWNLLYLSQKWSDQCHETKQWYPPLIGVCADHDPGFVCLKELRWRQAIIWTNSGILLTHWGRVTHLCVSKLPTIGSDNGLSPDGRQAIIWTNAGILLIGPLGTNFIENSDEIHLF